MTTELAMDPKVDAATDATKVRRYRIQTVARLTGLATPLLRAWERRHRLVVPARGPSGYREYTDEDVEVLRRARRLMERGYTISEVARLGRAALLKASGDELLLPGRPTGTDLDHTPLVAAFLKAVMRGDVGAAEQSVAKALHGDDLSAALKGFVRPALVGVGDAWERGELGPGVEHLATYLLRAPLTQLLATANAGLGPTHAVTCSAAGDPHELGALMVALELARAGRRTVHLGSSLPAKELVEVAQLARAQLLCVSFVHHRDPVELGRLFGELQAASTARLTIAVGGRALHGLEGLAREHKLLHVTDVSDLLED
jgi:methanogenic corrinoid protein MtbC1